MEALEFAALTILVGWALVFVWLAIVLLYDTVSRRLR